MVNASFDAVMADFIKFYNSLKEIDKTDIDNLLKSKPFDDAYKKRIEKMIGKLPDTED